MYSQQKTSMIMLKVLQKTLATSVDVMVRELGIKKGEKIWIFCAALNVMVGSSFFNKSASHLIAYQSGPCKTQVKYFLERKDQRKLVKDVSILPSEDCITQHKPLVYDVYDFKIGRIRNIRISEIRH